jgi:hypothetical protein
MSNPYRRVLEAGQISCTTWVFSKQLASEQLHDGDYSYEMRAVYSCTKAPRAEGGDSETGMKTVIKVKIQ